MQPIRFHHLRAVGRSPAHGLHALEGEEQDPTYSMERGNGVDSMLYGTREVIAYPGAQRRGKEWEAFQAAHADALILTASDFALAEGMLNALQAHRRAMQLLVGKGIVNQHTLLWKLAGRDCRTTPDSRGPEHLAELKSTGNASPTEFYWHVKRNHYAAQLAWQEIGAVSCGFPAPTEHYIVAVEQKPPHVVQVYRLGPRIKLAAAKLARLWFEQLVNCERSGAWPGYCESDLELEDQVSEDDLVFAGDEAA